MRLSHDIRRTLALLVGVLNAGAQSTLRAVSEIAGDSTPTVRTRDGQTVWAVNSAIPRMLEVASSLQRAAGWAQDLMGLPDEDLVGGLGRQIKDLRDVVAGIGRTIDDGWNPQTTGLTTPSVNDWDLYVHAKQLLSKVADLVEIASGNVVGEVIWFSREAHLPAGLSANTRYIAKHIESDFLIATDAGTRHRVPRSQPHSTTPIES